RVPGRRNGSGFTRGEGFELGWFGEPIRLLDQELFTRLVFRFGRASAEDTLKGAGHKRANRAGVAAGGGGDARGELAGLGERERAVREGQCLLRHHALITPVAFLGAGGVEEL